MRGVGVAGGIGDGIGPSTAPTAPARSSSVGVMAQAFQVVLEWGGAGLEASRAHVTIVADADLGATGEALVTRATGDPARPVVVLADLESAPAAARAALDAQHALGDRASIAIIAAGDTWPDRSLRPAAADELVAGAVVDALCELGIDFHSPACAVASAAYTALRRGARHLASAERSSRDD